MQEYQIYTDGKSKVIATYKFNNKTIRGVAKCHPEDNFDYAIGEKIALLKCKEKVLRKKSDRIFIKKEIAKSKSLKYMDELAKETAHYNDLLSEISDIQTLLTHFKTCE